MIKESCIPKDNDPSHPPTIVGEKHEISLLGFIKLGLNEQDDHDFPEDLLHDWSTHVSPKTSVDHVGITPSLLVTPLAQNATTTEPTNGKPLH